MTRKVLVKDTMFVASTDWVTPIDFGLGIIQIVVRRETYQWL